MGFADYFALFLMLFVTLYTKLGSYCIVIGAVCLFVTGGWVGSVSG